MTHNKNKDHPIIQPPQSFDVVDFHYHRSLDDPDACWIDLVLQKEDETRRLRFMKPQDISIEKGFPDTEGLFIADVSERGLEGLKVHVGDYGCGGGGIEFWAADVYDLDRK